MFAAPAWLWIFFTISAAAAQTARNAMQRDLIATLGAPGATFVRFLYGLPFGLLFLGFACLVSAAAPPSPPIATFAWTALGAVAQICATGLMLAAMRERSFVVAIAYTKAEPILVALFGLIFLGDHVTPLLALSIFLATLGVLLMSWPKTLAEPASPAPDGAALSRRPASSRYAASSHVAAWRPAILGVSSAALFALSAVGYRAGIIALNAPNFLLGAAAILALTLSMQSGLILIGLFLFDRPGLTALLRAWRPSLFAGFMGALASQFWFLAFALDSAARVRTLALLEMIFAQIVTKRVFRQQTSPRDYAGMALMLTGVVLLLWS